MENVIKALEAQVIVFQRKVDAANKELAEVRQMLEHARVFAKNGHTLNIQVSGIEEGRFRGMKPAQAIRALLQSRGNPGLSQDDISDALVGEGTVFKGKKYPKRGVSLAIANSPNVFEEKNGLTYLRSETDKVQSINEVQTSDGITSRMRLPQQRG